MLQRLQKAVGWPLSSSNTRVNFHVTAKLSHGECIYVVGDIAILGGSLSLSNTNHGLKLVTTPSLYPVWYTSNSIEVKTKTVIQYKYAVYCAGEFVRFENIRNMRSLTAKENEVSTQDELDVLEKSDMQFVSIVPRLSSGMAFHEDKSQRRRFTTSSPPITASIPEEHELGATLKGTALEEHGLDSTFALKEKLNSADGLGTCALEGKLGTSALKDELVGTVSSEMHGLKNNNIGVLERNNGGDRQGRFGCGGKESWLSPKSRWKRMRGMSEENDVVIEASDGVILVANYLPVKVFREDGEWVVEWEKDNLLCPSGRQMVGEVVGDSTRLTWVGMVRGLEEKEDEELVKALGRKNCVAVFLKKSKLDFEIFSQGTLWPVFHNIVDVYGKYPTRWWNPNEQKKAWRAYTDANRMFVNKVIELYNEGDLVWVHGIDLLLAPSFLARRLPFANVGIFLHSPFPSSEIFRTLSVREEILRGMLSADHIGFHLYEYARHFLTSCRRILGVKYSIQTGGYIGIEYNGRTVMVTITYIGIAPNLFDNIVKDQEWQDNTQNIVENLPKDKTMIVGIDHVERLKGIPLKLKAFESFLNEYPQFADTCHFVQVGIKSQYFANEPSSIRCLEEIQDITLRLNQKFGKIDQPIVSFIHQDETHLEDRIPFWSIADIMLDTTIRDAVNLYPFEFVYAQKLAKRAGIAVLSEFSGSSRVLTGCLGVNPWKSDEIIHAIYIALTMNPIERQARFMKNLEYVETNTRTSWAERVLIDLKRARRDASEGECMGYGLGLGFRMMEFNAGFKQLDIDELTKAYRTSLRRVLLFDFGDTLVSDETTQYSIIGTSKESILTAPTEVTKLLESLCSDIRNTVFVLTGRDKSEMESTLGHIRGLGMAAEHGYYYRWGEAMQSDEGWCCTKDNFDTSWKDVTHSVMDIYTQRTHGTYIEVKGSALLWQFRDADPEFGQLQAKELQDQLTQVLEPFPVEVLMGGEYLEVRPEGVDKGNMVDRIISTIESTNERHADFILCIGDDKSDEFMFSYLEEHR